MPRPCARPAYGSSRRRHDDPSPALRTAGRIVWRPDSAVQWVVVGEELDCLRCGACCRQASDGRILVSEQDLLRWKRQGRTDILGQIAPGHFGLRAFASTRQGACVHLGTVDSAHACRIYEDRGTTCRDFERGCDQCHEFRRDAGLEPSRS